MKNQTLTAVEGIRVGHAQNLDAMTGCTVIICPPETTGGVDQRGGAPGTRELDLLRPLHRIEYVNAILLTGGSAYGMAAAIGVMSTLEQQGIGHVVGVGVVPIVPGAVIYDLNVGSPSIRPDANMGAQATERASDAVVTEGCVGAGTGATVGKFAGLEMACKAGVGSAAIELPGGIIVAALMVVNAVGDILADNGTILAGARQAPNGDTFANSLELAKMGLAAATAGTNTTIGVVATNAKLSKNDTNKMAQMAHNGLARAIRPVHTMYDGDTVFALATNTGPQADVSILGAFAAEVTAHAIRRAATQATPMAGLPSATTMNGVNS